MHLLAAKRALSPGEISLYVGIPFCPTRCAYCSFVSNSVEKSLHLVEPYLSALFAEIDAAAEMVRDLGLRVRSFYMGGGTPTTLSADQMDRLLGRLAERFDRCVLCAVWSAVRRDFAELKKRNPRMCCRGLRNWKTAETADVLQGVWRNRNRRQ